MLDALAQHCTKATFFPIGKHALWHPEILKEVAAAGHTIGGHTWSHANLGKLKGDKATEEIEKGFSAVKLALGAPPAPFFRFPYLQDPKDQLAYLGSRNIAIFSHDLDSFDFKMRKPEDVIKSVMTKLERKGKGIILMHDFQQATAKAMPDLLNELKAKGYKVVHMKAKTPVTTLAQWDEAAKKRDQRCGGRHRAVQPRAWCAQSKIIRFRHRASGEGTSDEVDAAGRRTRGTSRPGSVGKLLGTKSKTTAHRLLYRLSKAEQV